MAPTYVSRDPGSSVFTAYGGSPLSLKDVMSLAEIKRQARSRAIIVRNDVHEAAKSGAGVGLAAQGLPVSRNAQNNIISAFHSFGTEISTFEFFDKLVAEGWTTALPVVVAKNTPLVFRQWAPGDKLVPGRWDIKVPPEMAPEVQPDVLLVPMLAFDRRGYRLGYGGGFYDRTLQRLRETAAVTAVGLAYDEQHVDEVPHLLHDEPLDWVLTPSGLRRCGGR